MFALIDRMQIAACLITTAERKKKKAGIAPGL